MELATLDATAQAALVSGGQLTPVDLVASAIERIEKWNGTLGAVIHPRFERALAEAGEVDPATQPFAGVPLLLKDAGAEQAGEPHHQGMRALRERDYREAQDAWLVERLRSAGFVIVGRTNAPELCTLPTTEPVAYGATHNPWSLPHSTGGSSGGSAAAVAAGLTPLAHASDGGGSIRMPASCCGLVGLKPSRGRITCGPLRGDSWGGLSTDGVLTRSLRDTAAVLDWVAEPGVGDPSVAPPLPCSLGSALVQPFAGPPLRIGVRTQAYAGGDVTHPDCEAAVAQTCAALEEAGQRVTWDSPEALDDPRLPGTQSLIVAVSLAASVADFGKRSGREIGLDELEPVNAASVEAGRAYSALDYATARAELQAYTRRVVAWWENYDLLLTPTLTDPPPRLGEIRGDLSEEEGVALRRRFGWLTPPWNITGQPAISLPVSVSAAGLPIGVQLVAAPGREDVLVRVGAQLEAVGAFSQRRAPCHA